MTEIFLKRFRARRHVLHGVVFLVRFFIQAVARWPMPFVEVVPIPAQGLQAVEIQLLVSAFIDNQLFFEIGLLIFLGLALRTGVDELFSAVVTVVVVAESRRAAASAAEAAADRSALDARILASFAWRRAASALICALAVVAAAAASLRFWVSPSAALAIWEACVAEAIASSLRPADRSSCAVARAAFAAAC